MLLICRFRIASAIILLAGFILCETQSGPCDPGWTQIDDACYLIDNSKQFEWSKAKTYCESIHATLPSIHSAEQNQKLLLLTKEFYAGKVEQVQFWIGLNCRANEFAWMDGSPYEIATITVPTSTETSTSTDLASTTTTSLTTPTKTPTTTTDSGSCAHTRYFIVCVGIFISHAILRAGKQKQSNKYGEFT